MRFIQFHAQIFQEDDVVNWGYEDFLTEQQQKRVEHYLNRICDILNHEKPSDKARKRFRVL